MYAAHDGPKMSPAVWDLDLGNILFYDVKSDLIVHAYHGYKKLTDEDIRK
jgi:hypothetical protein